MDVHSRWVGTRLSLKNIVLSWSVAELIFEALFYPIQKFLKDQNLGILRLPCYHQEFILNIYIKGWVQVFQMISDSQWRTATHVWCVHEILCTSRQVEGPHDPTFANQTVCVPPVSQGLQWEEGSDQAPGENTCWPCQHRKQTRVYNRKLIFILIFSGKFHIMPLQECINVSQGMH